MTVYKEFQVDGKIFRICYMPFNDFDKEVFVIDTSGKKINGSAIVTTSDESDAKFHKQNALEEVAKRLEDQVIKALANAFAWTKDNAKTAAMYIARYPAGRQQSAVMALLDLAQRQVGDETKTQGWLPVPVIEYVAAQLGMPYMRAYEVVTFYTMYNLAPVGRYHVQVCGTTPCLLRGSDDVLAACKNRGLVKGGTTPDGLFTLTEVECLGACANAPMVQINDDNFEDLTYDSMAAILEALATDQPVKIGPQIDRQTSCPEGGPTTLLEFAK